MAPPSCGRCAPSVAPQVEQIFRQAPETCLLAYWQGETWACNWQNQLCWELGRVEPSSAGWVSDARTTQRGSWKILPRTGPSHPEPFILVGMEWRDQTGEVSHVSQGPVIPEGTEGLVNLASFILSSASRTGSGCAPPPPGGGQASAFPLELHFRPSS